MLMGKITTVGGAGSIAVQMAKAFGAKEVITTVSTSKMKRAQELFAGVVDKCTSPLTPNDAVATVLTSTRKVIDYKTQDPVEVLPPRHVDFIFDTVGTASSLFPILKKNHTAISIGTMPSGSSVRESFPN